jgi:hypothetical protein
MTACLPLVRERGGKTTHRDVAHHPLQVCGKRPRGGTREERRRQKRREGWGGSQSEWESRSIE